PARRDCQVGSAGDNADSEPSSVEGGAARADDILGFGLRPVSADFELLVPVGVELDPALLHQHPAVVFAGIENPATEIGCHGSAPVPSSGAGTAQLAKKTPASKPNRKYSSRRARRTASRCAWKR